MILHDLHAQRCGCDGGDVLPGLLPLDDALRTCAQHTGILQEAETLPLVGAAGRHLARPLTFRAGGPPLQTGHCLGRRDIALAVATGAEAATVRRRVRVALLPSGTQASAVGRMLGALMDRADIEIVTCRPSTEGEPSPGIPATRPADAADLVVTIGEAPADRAEHRPGAAATAGETTIFAGVAIAPGGAVSFGRIGQALHLSLPGDIVAAFVGWHMFGRAIVSNMQGAEGENRKTIVAAVGRLDHTPGRCELRPARLVGFDESGRARVESVAAPDADGMHALAQADGLLLIPAHEDEMRPGDLLEFYPLKDC